MRGRDGGGDLEATDAAFNRALEAEAEARRAVEACRLQAAEVVAAAAERCRAIERRTQARLLLVHRCADAKVERAVSGLAADRPGQDAQPADALSPTLSQAVECLADEIIGAPRGLVESDLPQDGPVP